MDLWGFSWPKLCPRGFRQNTKFHHGLIEVHAKHHFDRCSSKRPIRCEIESTKHTYLLRHRVRVVANNGGAMPNGSNFVSTLWGGLFCTLAKAVYMILGVLSPLIVRLHLAHAPPPTFNMELVTTPTMTPRILALLMHYTTAPGGGHGRQEMGGERRALLVSGTVSQLMIQAALRA